MAIITVCYVLYTFYIIQGYAFQDTCHTWSQSVNKYLATKTPYRFVANYDDSEIQFDGCNATKVWMMVRHGTRYPGAGVIDDMRNVLPDIRDEIIIAQEEGRSSFCNGVIESFQDWIPIVPNNAEQKDLAHEGEEELIALAERYAFRLPSVFPSVYSSHYLFRSTKTQRTLTSLRSFLIGLFDRHNTDAIWPVLNETTNNLTIIRFYKQCPRWRRDVDENPISLLERKKYEAHLDWLEMRRNITERMGRENLIDEDTMMLFYLTCSFETAWVPNKRSPWCAVFSEDDLKRLDYAEDLEYYHIDGYGHPLNYLQACPAVQDLIRLFTQQTGVYSSISFTHAGTLLKLLTHFGLYNESIHHSYVDPNRTWNIGRINGFATNIAFVLFKCGLEDKFLFLHQERPVPLPGCPKDGLCPLSVLLKSHGGSLENCRFAEMCRIPENNEVY